MTQRKKKEEKPYVQMSFRVDPDEAKLIDRACAIMAQRRREFNRQSAIIRARTVVSQEESK